MLRTSRVLWAVLRVRPTWLWWGALVTAGGLVGHYLSVALVGLLTAVF